MSAGRAGKTAKNGLNPVRRRAGGVSRRNGSRAIRSPPLRWQRLSPAPMIYLFSNTDIWQHPEECKPPQHESEHPALLVSPPILPSCLPLLSSPLRPKCLLLPLLPPLLHLLLFPSFVFHRFRSSPHTLPLLLFSLPSPPCSSPTQFAGFLDKDCMEKKLHDRHMCADPVGRWRGTVPMARWIQFLTGGLYASGVDHIALRI